VHRVPTHRYLDPLDAIWLEVARRVGFRVVRSPDVYASTDGAGTLTIGTPETLDPDDCLAQMIFHELCHSMIEGPSSLAVPDFGLDNESARDVVREHACLRLQAAVAEAHGLRAVLAPTTDFRAYYDALPGDPLGDGTDPAIPLARAARARFDAPPWAPHVDAGLRATSAVVRAVGSLGVFELELGLPLLLSP